MLISALFKHSLRDNRSLTRNVIVPDVIFQFLFSLQQASRFKIVVGVPVVEGVVDAEGVAVKDA